MEQILSVEHLRWTTADGEASPNAVDDVKAFPWSGSLWDHGRLGKERAPCSTASPQLIPPQRGISGWRGRM